MLPKFRAARIDMTGIGLGLYEFSVIKPWGRGKIGGINFASTVPVTARIQAEGRKAPSVRVTEAMAIELLGVYSDRRIRHPADQAFRDDLRKRWKNKRISIS
jgi:hypothetical protein